VFGDEEHTGAPIELTQENPDHERHRPSARHRRRQPAHHRPPGSVPASRRRPGSEPGRASPTPHPGAWVPVLCTGSQHDWPPTPGCTPPPTPAATSVSRTATCHRGQGADRGRLPTGRSWPPPRSMPPARTSTSRCSPTPGPACYARSGSSARVAERLAVVPRTAGFATIVARGTQMRSASRPSRSTRSLRVGTTTALPATIIQPTVGHERRVQRCRDEAPTNGLRAGEPRPGTALPGRLETPAIHRNSSPPACRHRPPGSVPARRSRPGSEPGRAPPAPHPGGWVLCALHREPARLATDRCRHQRWPARLATEATATSVARTDARRRGTGEGRGCLPR
jgi:hypothetical protein